MKKNDAFFLVGSRNGFTLVELLITIVIAAIVAAIAMPNLETFVKNSRISSAANDLLRSIQTARSEAAKRQVAVVFCMSSNPTAAVPSCSKTSLTGWIVFQDDDNDWGRGSASEPLIEAHTFETTQLSLVADNSMRVSFAPTGFATTDGTTAATQTRSSAIVMCDSRGNTPSSARGLSIDRTGRPRVTKTTTQITALLSTIGSTCP